MLKNNLKIALRALRKNKLYAFVTLAGLTVGVAAALLIFRMVNYELGFNQSLPNYERIARVVHVESEPDGTKDYGVCMPIPAMDVIENSVSQFKAMSRVKEFWATIAQPDPNGGPPLKKFNMDEEETAFFAEPAFFDVIQAKVLAGDPAAALNEPGVIVLTKSWSDKFFTSPDQAIGKLLLIDNTVPVTVKGVIADLPVNTDFPLPFLSSWKTLKANADYFFYIEEWGTCSSSNQVYALLGHPSQVDATNAVLANVGKEEYSNRTGKQTRRHELQLLSDMHFNEDLSHSGTHRVSKSRLRILGGVGILILIMACFNFVNLATAQAALRAREIGVRKTLGSTKRQLMMQFMTETGLIVVISVVAGFILAQIALPFLQHISDVPASWPFIADPGVWIFLLLTAVIVTFLAGFYPALVLAGFRPVEALKNKVSQQTIGGVSLRKSLVVLQFTIAQVLIVGAIITLLQLDYIRTTDLGFSDDLIYTFSMNVDSSSIARQSALKQQLLQLPTVEQVSFNHDHPLSGNTWAQNFRYASRPEEEPYSITMKFADADYQDTYNLRLLAGEWYTPSDTIRAGVVNMTLLEKLGINNPDEVVGQTLYLGGAQPVRLTGVVEDFHTHSLHEEMLPLLLTTNNNYYWNVGVKMRPDQLAVGLAGIQEVYNNVMPEQVFEGRFLDESIAQFYQDEDRLAATCKGFGLLAVLISCLGLFGLAAHAAQQRVKEIGVRKVLGATTSGIVSLLSKDFLMLVGIALVVATPIAYFLMSRWLQGFAFRIDMEWWVFGLAGLIAISVAFLTVSYQSIKAAIANPVKALRSE